MRVIVWRRSHVNSGCWKLLRCLVVLVLLVALVIPVRNVLLFFALPGMWMEHNSWFLLKVLWDFQYFPVDKTPIEPSPIQLDINFDELESKFIVEPHTFQEYHKRTQWLQKLSSSDVDAQAELEQLKKFQPLSEHERAKALFTLDVFIKACEAANLTYFLISGSILGAMRHHGMIPWDDDIDIVMYSAQWEKIRNVLSNINGFELFAPSGVQWKFFMKSLPQSNRPFKWPNVDIFFFNQDASYVWAQTWGAKASLCSKKSDIFPLRRRKFERWDMPVPRAAKLLVAAEFGDFSSTCKTAVYDHRANLKLSSSSLTDIHCEKLHNVYPFVFQEKNKSGTITELRKVAGQRLDNISVPVGA